MRIVVIGGGYAGIACLIELRKHRLEAEFHLVDPGEYHLKLTHLHETLRRPLGDIRKPFTELGRLIGFEFHQEPLSFTADTLHRWQTSKVLPLRGGDLPFDFLVVATGALAPRLPSSDKVLGVGDFRTGEGQETLRAFLAEPRTDASYLNVVGGGATGVQFLFALREMVRRSRSGAKLRLIESNPTLLSELPAGFHRYVGSRLRHAGIECLLSTRFVGQSDQDIRLQDLRDKREYELPSGLTLFFPGALPQPFPLLANHYGQVVLENGTLPDIFAVGDCVQLDSSGLNSLTAQAAVRKGKQIAANIVRGRQRRRMQEYSYRETGFFLSLGPLDGVGWLLSKYNLLYGPPAFSIKEMIEMQYDLFINGLDTYQPLWPRIWL